MKGKKGSCLYVCVCVCVCVFVCVCVRAHVHARSLIDLQKHDCHIETNAIQISLNIFVWGVNLLQKPIAEHLRPSPSLLPMLLPCPHTFAVVEITWILYSCYVVNDRAIIRQQYVIADKRGHFIVVGGNLDILSGLRLAVTASLFTLV